MAVVDFTFDFVAGLQRPQMAMRGGVPTMHDTSANEANKAHIRAAYRNECVRRYGAVAYAPRGVPVDVTIVASRELPPSVRPRSLERQPDTVKPDLDNVIKLVLDALNRYAWDDDCQVTHIDAYKADRVRGLAPWTQVKVIFDSEEPWER